jgi:hypothetical protein
MDDLLQTVVSAHGGLKRWSASIDMKPSFFEICAVSAQIAAEKGGTCARVKRITGAETLIPPITLQSASKISVPMQRAPSTASSSSNASGGLTTSADAWRSYPRSPKANDKNKRAEIRITPSRHNLQTSNA